MKAWRRTGIMRLKTMEVCSLLLLRMRTEHIQPRKNLSLAWFKICSVVIFTLLYQIHYISKHNSSSSVICKTTGPKPLPKRFLHIVPSRASSFNWQYPLLSLRSSSSFLRILPRLLVTSICPFIFPSITCCRRQFLRKMWPIQLAFRFLIEVYLTV